VLRGETEGQTLARGNCCSRHRSNAAEPQQTTGTSDFANDEKAVPRTSPTARAPPPPSPRLHMDWMEDFIRTLNSEAVKSLCKKPIIPIFVTANLSSYLGPLTPLCYIKHFFHLKCSFLKAILLNLIDAQCESTDLWKRNQGRHMAARQSMIPSRAHRKNRRG